MHSDQEDEVLTNFFEEVPAEPTGDEPADDTAADDTKVDSEVDDRSVEDQGEESDDEGLVPKKDPRDQSVPFQRFQKAKNRLDSSLQENEALKRRLAELESSKVDESNEDDDIELDERSRKALDKYIRDNGLVRKADIEADRKLVEAREQVKKDIGDVTGWVKQNGYPDFDAVAVDQWADENLGKNFVKNRATLKAAYLAMNEDTIRESERKAALASNNTVTGERPGAAAHSVVPEAPSSSKKNPIRTALSAALDEYEQGVSNS